MNVNQELIDKYNEYLKDYTVKYSNILMELNTIDFEELYEKSGVFKDLPDDYDPEEFLSKNGEKLIDITTNEVIRVLKEIGSFADMCKFGYENNSMLLEYFNELKGISLDDYNDIIMKQLIPSLKMAFEANLRSNLMMRSALYKDPYLGTSDESKESSDEDEDLDEDLKIIKEMEDHFNIKLEGINTDKIGELLEAFNELNYVQNQHPELNELFIAMLRDILEDNNSGTEN
jgi:hypothetical protein